MTTANVCIILAIVVYLVGMIVIGYFNSKTTGSSSDFYLGGRKLGPVVTALSTEASDMSAYLLMGVPGPGAVLRRGGGELDGDRSRGRHLSQLAVRGKAPAPVFRKARRHHRAGLSGPALP